MPSPQPSLDQLHQVQELNRLFLAFLQTRVREQLDCLGLPDRARPALRTASGVLLDAVAEFPRALFRLLLDEAERQPRRPPSGRVESAQQALSLTLLLCAWTLSRQSAYQARLLLGLESRAVQRLRALQLTELQGLAHGSSLVRCAFPEREWLWTELLTERRPEARQRLVLVALQPGLERDWPVRHANSLT